MSKNTTFQRKRHDKNEVSRLFSHSVDFNPVSKPIFCLNFWCMTRHQGRETTIWKIW